MSCSELWEEMPYRGATPGGWPHCLLRSSEFPVLPSAEMPPGPGKGVVAAGAGWLHRRAYSDSPRALISGPQQEVPHQEVPRGLSPHQLRGQQPSGEDQAERDAFV